MCVEVRDDYVRRFPWSGPIWLLDAERKTEGTDGSKPSIEKDGIGNSQHPKMRSGVLAKISSNCAWLRVHEFQPSLWFRYLKWFTIRIIILENDSLMQ